MQLENSARAVPPPTLIWLKKQIFKNLQSGNNAMMSKLESGPSREVYWSMHYKHPYTALQTYVRDFTDLLFFK